MFKQQISVLADDIDQLVNDEFRRLESVVLDVAPGLVAHRSIGLPMERTNVAKLAAFEVENGGVLLHGVILVVDDADMVAILQ